MSRRTETRAPTILALVDNMFFGARIEGAARHLGLRLAFAKDEAEFRSLLADTQPALIIVDMVSATPWEPLVRQLKADPATAAVPVLAFGRHTHAELFKLARRAGCDKAITNAELSENLPALLEEYVGLRR